MRPSAAFLIFSLLAAADEPRSPTPASFRYSRTLTPPGMASNAHYPFACAVLDADVFAHSDATLSDLRLFNASGTVTEVPYVITLSSAPGTPEPARLLNLGLKSPNSISFDLRMPSRPYSALDLQLKAQDFIASATLTGLRSPRDNSPTYLGSFTLFDLTSQRLGRNAHLEFAESTFPYLHLNLKFTPAPGRRSPPIVAGVLTGAEIPASRLAQIAFAPAFTTSLIAQQPRKSVATFKVPAHVPLERVSFELGLDDQTSFSRRVLIAATPDPHSAQAAAFPEQVAGEITRVHLDEAGQEIRDNSLSVPAVLGSNAQGPATIQVAIENGDDRPLHIKSVRLEMRRRDLCIYVSPASIGDSLPTLFYGAAGFSPPVYDLGRLFDPAKPSVALTLGPEERNQLYAPAAPAPISFTERHPAVLWLALLAAAALLGVVAFRSAKRI